MTFDQRPEFTWQSAHARVGLVAKIGLVLFCACMAGIGFYAGRRSSKPGPAEQALSDKAAEESTETRSPQASLADEVPKDHERATDVVKSDDSPAQRLPTGSERSDTDNSKTATIPVAPDASHEQSAAAAGRNQVGKTGDAAKPNATADPAPVVSQTKKRHISQWRKEREHTPARLRDREEVTVSSRQRKASSSYSNYSALREDLLK